MSPPLLDPLVDLALGGAALAQVLAGGEGTLSRAGEHDGPDPRITLQRLASGDDLAPHRPVPGVENGRPIEDHEPDLVPLLDCNEVRHRLSLPTRARSRPQARRATKPTFDEKSGRL